MSSADQVRRLLAILRKATAEGVVDVLQNLQVVMGRVTFIGRWSVLVKLPLPNSGDLAWCTRTMASWVYNRIEGSGSGVLHCNEAAGILAISTFGCHDDPEMRWSSVLPRAVAQEGQVQIPSHAVFCAEEGFCRSQASSSSGPCPSSVRCWVTSPRSAKSWKAFRHGPSTASLTSQSISSSIRRTLSMTSGFRDMRGQCGFCAAA